MKKYIPFTLFILGIISIVSCNTITSKTPSVQEKKYISSNSAVDKTTPIKPKYETIPTPSDTKQETTSKPSDQIPQGKNIYETISLDEAALETQARKNITPLAAIRIKYDTIRTLQPDDTLLITDIEGIDYTLHISNTIKHSDGSITTTGSYSDEGIKYTTTMTLSQEESYITLSTAQGSYEIETRNGVGYIYKTETIRKQMHNTNLNDMIIFPRPQKSP